MIEMWLSPILSRLGIGLVPLLLIILIIVLVLKG